MGLETQSNQQIFGEPVQTPLLTHIHDYLVEVSL